MDKKAKIVFFLFILSVLILVFFLYKKHFLDKDYLIFAEIPCDPSLESCFVSLCNSDEEECAGVLEEDTTYFKKLERHAELIPSCDPNREGCFVAQCDAENVGCGITLCNPNEDECSSPEDFLVPEESFESDSEGATDTTETSSVEQPQGESE